MHLKYRNVNDAFVGIVSSIMERKISVSLKPSRVGDVLQIEEPVIVTFERPLERVLFNTNRDCNPFFHLFESLWMLAGRNDVAPLVYYSSKIGEIVSDDGVTANGAYGYRWRHADSGEVKYSSYQSGDGYGSGRVLTREPIIVDQLSILASHLLAKPDSRRAVLQMWNVEDDLQKIDKSKDVCCNTAAYFSVRTNGAGLDSEGTPKGLHYALNSYLDMTVTNRSNDLTWGMLGANVVHFAFLQEYMAAKIGCGVGVYNQFTNNLHAYTSRWEPERWLDGYGKYRDQHSPRCYSYEHDVKSTVPLVADSARFDKEVVEFIDFPEAGYNEPFLRDVATPMCVAFRHYKDHEYGLALEAMNYVKADDWMIAGVNWLKKRKLLWENRNVQSGKGE